MHFFLIDVDYWLFVNNTNNNMNPLSLGLMTVMQTKNHEGSTLLGSE